MFSKVRSYVRLGAFVVVLAVIAFMNTGSAHAVSESDCAARADRAARDSTGVAGGAVRGAAGGALFGAIVSDKSGKGAMRGAALGGVVGGLRSSKEKDDVYKREYDACMRAR